MIFSRKFFQTIVIGLFLAAWLMACSPSLTSGVLPSPNPEVETVTPALTPTVPLSLPTQTETPAPLPTSDLWAIQKCRKTPSFVSDHAMIWTYSGDIERYGQVDMLLSFTEYNEIKGFVFDFGRMREYRVNGCVEDRTLTMWLQHGDSVDAVIRGEFPETDPRGNYPSSKKLDSAIITGLLTEKGSEESLAIDLRFGYANGGTMEHRFELEGVKDDRIILNASRQFLAAIARDNREQVAEMIHFPLECNIQGEFREMQTQEMFMSYYNAILNDDFKKRLMATFPNYLIAYSGNFGGIGLTVYGGGAIVFDLSGKVTAINNWKNSFSPPLATITSTPESK